MNRRGLAAVSALSVTRVLSCSDVSADCGHHNLPLMHHKFERCSIDGLDDRELAGVAARAGSGRRVVLRARRELAGFGV